MWLEHAAEQREWGEEMERRAEGIMREFGPGGQEDEVYDEEKGMNFDEGMFVWYLCWLEREC